MKIHSLNQSAMHTHMDLYLSLMFGPFDIKRAERELIGVVVSAVNNGEYCVKHHAAALDYYWRDNEKIKRLIENFKSLNLPEKQRKMLGYVVKLTRSPHTMNESDVVALRGSGFSDEDILNINLITSYFCFVNRIALGLGIESTPEEGAGYKY